jgi:hypothetical protein
MNGDAAFVALLTLTGSAAQVLIRGIAKIDDSDHRRFKPHAYDLTGSRPGLHRLLAPRQRRTYYLSCRLQFVSFWSSCGSNEGRICGNAMVCFKLIPTGAC